MFARPAWRCATSARWPVRLPLPLRVNGLQRFTKATFSSTTARQAQYNRFTRAQYVAYLWKNSPTFRRATGAVGGAAVLFYVTNLESVPGSGRRRFNCVSPELEKRLAQYGYRQLLEEYRGQILPESAPETRRVDGVLERLIPNSGVHDGNWEVRVIQDDTPNAFVLPGNKVFVMSGILPICANDAGLATVLGHEIAHNLAHHVAENMSRNSLFVLGVLGVSFFLEISTDLPRLVGQLVFNLPGSRKQEAEADYLGLQMMAKSCFNPEEAVALWQRMEQNERELTKRGQGEPVPQFLSTHPSSYNRIAKIQEWLPEAQRISEQGDCHNLGEYANAFRDAWRM